MSNPFRRQAESFSTPDIPPHSSLDSSQSSTPTPDHTIPTASASKVKKVRITSPPRSPPPDPYSSTDSTPVQQRVIAARHSGSQPLHYEDESSSSDDDGPDDPFAREGSSGDESPVETKPRAPVAFAQTRSASGAPANPFSKTLAHMEGPRQFQGQQEQGHSSTAESQSDRRSSKPQMDVDAFKTLLMTGKTASGAPAGIQSKVLTNLQADSSSSTDTSSVSRQSLFETLQEPHGETPRTSYELSVSEDDDGSTLIAEGSKPEKRKLPPPAPKHRHGKVVAPKGPQTVAFDDFSPSFTSPSTQSLPITTSSPSQTKPTLPRTPTDLNKPLPPPPPRASSDEPRPTPLDLKSPTRPMPPTQSFSDPLMSPKKVPPAPPLARRSSQMRASNPVSSRSRSNTAASNLSQTGEEGSYPPSIAESNNSSQVKMAPPPPPTRRSRAATTDRPPSVDMHDSSLDRRQSIKSPPTLSRQQSHQSAHSITAPPLPPPRRNSTRSSTDLGRPGHRPSGEIIRDDFDDGRRSPGDVQEYVPIYEEPKHMNKAEKEEVEEMKTEEPEHDVLADMDAFQREIDELREKYSRGEG